ncbi:MAG: hypothetical protein AABZ02_10820 [Bacteroidota bacterium]
MLSSKQLLVVAVLFLSSILCVVALQTDNARQGNAGAVSEAERKADPLQQAAKEAAAASEAYTKARIDEPVKVAQASRTADRTKAAAKAAERDRKDLKAAQFKADQALHEAAVAKGLLIIAEGKKDRGIPVTDKELRKLAEERQQTEARVRAVKAAFDEAARKAQAAKESKRQTEAQPAAASQPKTQYEKLDELLKLYLNDKIDPREYHERRAKIISEP